MSDTVHVVCGSCNRTNRVPTEKLSVGAKCGSCNSALFDGLVLKLTTDNFSQHIKNNQLPVLVDYWASWCGPCKTMAPVFAATASKMKYKLRFAKVNTEVEQQLATNSAIRSIPTMILYHGGKEVSRISGAMDQSNLIAWIQQYV